jgi:hypothetical protein
MASSKKAVKKAPQAKKSAKLTRTALAKVMMPHADTDSPNSVSCSGLLANRFLHQFTLQDALNNPNFSNPNAAIGSSTVGTITGANTSRALQFTAKLTF